MAKIVQKNLVSTNKDRRITTAVSRLPAMISVADAYSKFLRVKRTETSPNTLKIYADMGERVVVPQLSELTNNVKDIRADDLRAILDDYAVDHDNGGVVFLHRHMRTFINWCWEEYQVDKPNPIKNVKVRKDNKPPKDGITQEEITKLLKSASTRSQFPERDVAFIMLLADTGIRRSSIANLKMSDVNLDRCELTVFEKDQQFHIKPFGASTQKAIKKYLNCLEDVEPNDPFWLCMDGKALDYVGMREILRRNCKGANIPVHQFHDFRRYYALQLYNQTHDIYTVSRALDHKSVEVTKRYLAIDTRESAELCRGLSPMDRVTRQTKIKIAR